MVMGAWVVVIVVVEKGDGGAGVASGGWHGVTSPLLESPVTVVLVAEVGGGMICSSLSSFCTLRKDISYRLMTEGNCDTELFTLSETYYERNTLSQ